MIIRKAFTASLALTGAMLAARIAAADVALPVPQIQQLEDEWCWAASTQAVLQYHQQMSISQCQIATWMEVTNGWSEVPAGKTAGDPNYCCDYPLNCDFTEPAPGVSGILGNFDIPGRFFGSGTPNNPPVTFAQVATELDRGNPVVYWLAYNGGGGHVEVIAGYSSRGGVLTLELMNPADGAYHQLTYAAATGGTGYSYYWDNAHFTQSINQNAGTSALDYRQAGGARCIYEFQPGSTDFWVDYTCSSSWSWADEGHPSGVTLAGEPQALTYQSSTGTQILSSFAVGEDNNLWNLYWGGSSWSWLNVGHPAGVTLSTFTSAVAYEEATNAPGNNIYDSPRIDVLALGAVGSSEQLYRASWNGSSWSWAAQGGTPAVCSTPSVITYRQNTTNTQHVYAFYMGCDGHMHLYYTTDSVNWTTGDLGAAPGPTVGSPSAIAFHEGFGIGIYSFILGSNGHLYVMYWNDAYGGGWHWADQGTPAGVTLTPGTYNNNVVSATTFREAGLQQHYIFAHGTNGHLYDNRWNGTAWSWEDRGMPASPVGGGIQALSYMEPGTTSVTHRIKTFVNGTDNHLYTNTWDGALWSWTDQAAPADVE